MAQWRRAIGGLALALALAACGDRGGGPVQFFAEGQPQKLSDWRLLERDGTRLSLNTGVVPYDLNTPLFTDYAHKLRTIWMPQGKAAKYQDYEAFDFPVGTIISKTFYYPLPEGGAASGSAGLANAVARSDASLHPLLKDERLDLDKVRLIETRLLVRREQGWVALPYVWNQAQTDAVLTRTGKQVALELVDEQAGTHESLAYQVPDQNQCAGCHATNNKSRHLAPIGPKARHLNREFDYAGGRENQLEHLQRVGYLQGAPAAAQAPRLADWQAAAKAGLDARARAYLDINCGHCHSATGAAVTSGMWMDAATSDRLKLGFCKQPIAAGKGTGDRLYDIAPGHADGSVVIYRMDSTDPSVMMPELGRSVVHREGVQLIREWIDAQQGNCES